MEAKLNEKQAKDKLWRVGNLEWKLKGVQKNMRRAVYESKGDKTVFLCSRQLGKSFVMMTIATEYCIKYPGSVVKVLFPKKKDAKTIARNHMRQILSDCPNDIKPEWKEADKVFMFPNESQIQMAGTDGGSAESVRGSSCHLAILDEAGFQDYNDFSYIIQSIIMPTLLTTNGKMILASTPSREPDHPFMTNYVEPARREGSLIEYTIYDNPLISKNKIDDIVKEFPGGFDDPDFQREFLLVSDIKGNDYVIPEFTKELQADVIRHKYDKPVYYDAYVSCDPALSDLTVCLFAYYDFLNRKLVITDELVIGGNDTNSTTQDIVDGMIRKEKINFSNPLTGEIQQPYLRVIDNNNKFLINDLNLEHNLNFIATAKDNKEAQISAVRIKLKRGDIIIDQKCKNLIYHLQTARWDKTRKGFQRVRAHLQKGLKAHHCDGLDALIYLVRNVDFERNPYPGGYFDLKGESVFNPFPNRNESGEKKEFMKDLMNIKKVNN